MRSAAALAAVLWLAAAGISVEPITRATADGTGADALGATVAAEPTWRDDVEDVSAWSAHPADGVGLTIGAGEGANGQALRMDVRFAGGGYAVARRAVELDLPENYVFSFAVRGDVPPNHLEFKLLDESGENVWWSVRRDMAFPDDWETVRIKKRHISFAWGPTGGGEIRRVGAIEIVVTAGSGGSGSVWIDDLTLTELPPADAPLPPPVTRASTSASTTHPDAVLDGRPETAWSPAPGDTAAWLTLDFGTWREIGGLTLDWVPDRHAPAYTVEASVDGDAWRALARVTGSNGGRDHLYLPETETRVIRLRPAEHVGGDGEPIALAEVTVRPIEWSASREAFMRAVVADHPRGLFPRGMSGEQTYWTVVGLDGDPDDALVGEDGAIETHPGGWSLEPFLSLRGDPSSGDPDRLVTWADVRTTHALDGGYLPIPSVTWHVDPTGGAPADLAMTITAFATGVPHAASLVAVYRVENGGASPLPATLHLALRPFQVNPPSQTLNIRGGTATITDITFDGETVHANGARAIRCLTAPSGFGATDFHGGDVVADHLVRGRLPGATDVHDDDGAASAAVSFDLELPAHGVETVVIIAPLTDAARVGDIAPSVEAWAEQALDAARTYWTERIDRVRIELPPSGRRVVESLKSQLGYILVNRAGAALQPGARAYARSWIRDGALTSTALLRMGHPAAVRSFIEWYAPHQYANGKVPCVVDDRGADPVPEHDSSGELIYLVAEYYRHTSDRDLVERLWPRVRAAVAYLDSLRRTRTTAAYRRPEMAPFYGILPPSISHEGYSAKPMHSYWDDLFALRGFRDAVFLADELALDVVRDTLATLRDTFERDLTASVVATMRHHDIDYVPGCADLGDFDPTSTTIAFSPVQATDVLPRAALVRTFERYDAFAIERRVTDAWDAYTPYELRNVGAFVRLGWIDGAHALLDFFFEHQRPAGWRQWAEVVAREARTPRFLGDMPHTWVGSDYIRAVLDIFAYAREADETLVVGAGVPDAWITEPPGVRIEDLRTRFGKLDLRVRATGDTLHAMVDGEVIAPPGGIVVRVPVGFRSGRARIGDRGVAIDPKGEVRGYEVPLVLTIVR